VAGRPIERVRVLEHIRGNKWKTEWIEPNPGLVHYVESGQLLCPWKERKAFLKEEENRGRLLKHNDELGYSENSPIAHALYQVFESVGESDLSFYKGVLRASPEALDRVRTRAGMKAATSSLYSYTDRQGKLQFPFDEALELARKFCAAEPSAVLVGVESTEREWAEKARTPGDEYMVPLLNEYRAALGFNTAMDGSRPGDCGAGSDDTKA